MPPNFHTTFIANPNAGGGTLGRRWSSISALIRGTYGPFHHSFTNGPGDATRLARQALADGFEMVVALGGDGTIGEVVNGLFSEEDQRRSDTVLGVLHFGTGGDFCRGVGAPKNLREAAQALAGHRIRTVDVGRLRFTTEDGEQRTRHFLNVASFGMSGMIDQLVNASSKRLGGRLAFATATVRAMQRYRAQEARLRLDGGDWHQVKLHTIAVANGQYFGGGMHIAPQAQLDDGLLDVITVGPMTMADLALHGYRLYRGTHIDLPQVSATTARRIEALPVDPSTKILLDVDGETPGQLPATFEVLPGALRLKHPRPR